MRHAERAKVRAATWLYRWSLAQGMVGVIFSALTFAGVFTILLGPVFEQLGLGYLSTLTILVVVAASLVLGLGFFLDRVAKFWKAQALVGTTRNPFLYDRLYQKELLTLTNQHLPVMRALQAINRDPRVAEELDRAIARLEETLRNKRWTIRPGEETYEDSR